MILISHDPREVKKELNSFDMFVLIVNVMVDTKGPSPPPCRPNVGESKMDQPPPDCCPSRVLPLREGENMPRGKVAAPPLVIMHARVARFIL